jgi:putative NADH-flavin reductase
VRRDPDPGGWSVVPLLWDLASAGSFRLAVLDLLGGSGATLRLLAISLASGTLLEQTHDRSDLSMFNYILYTILYNKSIGYTHDMKIAIIGAQGKSGQTFVRLALNNGHQVRAGILGKSPFELHERLEVVNCDATNQSDVTNLIKGCDAVVSLIGHVKGSPRMLQTEATQTIIAAMQQMKIVRFVSLTGTGARQKGDTPSLIDKILNFIVYKVDPDRVDDGVEHIKMLHTSNINWTVVRVLKLTKSRPRKFQLTRYGPAKLLTSRGEVASAILNILSTDEYNHTTPVISRR